MGCGQREKRRGRDIPDYKAVVLRPEFLAALFVLVTALMISLEYLIRTLPHEHDRNGIPRDFPYMPQVAENEKRDAQIPARRHRRAGAWGFGATPTASLVVRDGNPTRTTHATITSPILNKRRPDGLRYAPEELSEPIPTYATVAHRWHGHRSDPYARTALFPGQPAADKCIYEYQGIVLTTDKTACRAMIDPTHGQLPVPDGWRKASWVLDFLWVEIGGECDKDYDAWYAGYPSNYVAGLDLVIPGDAPKTMESDAEQQVVDNNDITGKWNTIQRSAVVFSGALMQCTLPNGTIRSDIDRLSEPRPDNREGMWKKEGVDDTPGPVLLVYQGLQYRDEKREKSIQWITSSHAGDRIYNQFVIVNSNGWWIMETTGVWLPPVPTPGLAGSPNQSNTTTTQNSNEHSASPTPTPRPASTAPSATPTGDLRVVSVNQEFEKATTFTTDGHATTSTQTFTVPTSILMNVPAMFVPASVTTVLDDSGNPITTSTNFNGNLILTTKLTTLTGPNGSPTAIRLTTAPASSRIVTYTNSDGIPVTTATSYLGYPHIPNSRPAPLVLIHPKKAPYFIVYFFPIALTLLLLIPIQTIDTEVKLLLPFRLLTSTASSGGTTDAMCLRTGGLTGRLNGWKLLWRHRDPISVVSDLLVITAAGLVAISGETVGLKMRGTCVKYDMRSCLITVAAFPVPARIAEALLGLLMVLILGLGVCLWWERTGTAVHPSSVAAVCALLQVGGAREVVRGLDVDLDGKGKGKKGDLDGQLREGLKGTWCRLDWVVTGGRANDYGIVACTPRGRVDSGVGKERCVRRVESGGRGKMEFGVEVGERTLQSVFLFGIAALLTLVLYYEGTEYKDPTLSPFEEFMDSQEFGVIMLFTGIGEVICFIWDHLDFTKKIVLLRLAQRPQPAASSVLQTRPTNVFSGLWQSLCDRDPLGVTMTFAGLLSKLLPALLSGIPFQAAQTYKTHEICTWGTVSVLIVMMFVLLYHMWRVKWPTIPASPDLLAGWVYYVCDSHMLRDFERLSMLSKRERDLRVSRMERRYRLGWIQGVSGGWRMGIDYAEGEQGYKMKSLGAMGFGVGGRVRG